MTDAAAPPAPASFDDWLNGQNDIAAQNRRPINFYQTALGSADMWQNPNDPLDVRMRGETRNGTDWNDWEYPLGDARLGTVRPVFADAPQQSASEIVQGLAGLPQHDPRVPVASVSRGNPFADMGSRMTLMQRFMVAAWKAQERGSGLFHPFRRPGIYGGDSVEAPVNSQQSARHVEDSVLMAQQEGNDPFYSDGPLSSRAAGAAVTGLGTFAGGLTDPLNLVMEGSSAIGRLLFQGLMGGVQNAGAQGSGGEAAYRQEADRIALQHDLDQAYREGGTPERDRLLTFVEQHPDADPNKFDWGEMGMSMLESAGFQGVFEGFGPIFRTSGGRRWRAAQIAAGRDAAAAVRGTVRDDGRGGIANINNSVANWEAREAQERFAEANARPPNHVQRALGVFGAPFVQAATKLSLRDMADPVLESLPRLADGSIDPRAMPVDAAFAGTPVWMQQMVPLVDRAGRATTPDERTAAYSEAALRLHEALQRGDDPADFSAAMQRAMMTGGLPEINSFKTLERIGREMQYGDLAIDQLRGMPDRLAALTERADPAFAKTSGTRRKFRDAFYEARSNMDETARAEAGARPPVDDGSVGPEQFPERRMVTDDERDEIDQLVHRAINEKVQKTGPSLVQWLVGQGGIKDTGGDVASGIGGSRARPGLINNKTGKEADDLARSAWEHGYFPEWNDRPPPRVLIDSVADEVAGRGARHTPIDDETHQQNLIASEVHDFLDRHDIAVGNGTPADEVRLKNEIAERVYDATYGTPIDDSPDADATLGTPAASQAKGKRALPDQWGAKRGQGQGGGGAMLSPLARVEQGITPIERQTFWRRTARQAERRGTGAFIRDTIARAYTMFVEAQHPLQLAQDELIREIARLTGAPVDLKASQNARMLARLSRDGYSPGHLDLVDGVRPYRQPNVVSSPSFREAIETATGGKEWTRDRVTRFEAYLIARRADKAWDRYHNGELPRPPHAMSQLDMRDAITQAELDHPEFKDGADLLYAFLREHWKKKRDAGFITDEQYQQGIASNEDYVPFQRDMHDTGSPSRGGEAAGATTGGGQNRAKMMKRFRGSDRKVLSPLSVIMADVYATADRIARNETYRAFVDLATRAGDVGEHIAKPIPRSFDKTQIDIVDEAKAAVKRAGGTQIDADAVASQLDSLLNGDTAHVIYRPGDVIEGGRKVIYVWRDGKREAWELTDPEWADDLFKSMTGLTQESRDLFLDIVALPTQTIRTAIIAWPGFVISNLFRDMISAWMVTDVNYKPGESFTHGIGQALRVNAQINKIRNAFRRANGQPTRPHANDMASLYNAVGSQGGGIVRSALPRTHLERDLPALRGKILRMRNLNPAEGALTLWRAFETATELSENAGRIRLFARAYQKAKAAGETDHDASLWAAYESRDYMDFQRSGSKMLNVRRLALFLNASVQGLDRTGRTLSAEGRPDQLLRSVANVVTGKTPWAGLSAHERAHVARAYKYWAKWWMVGMFGLGLTALNSNDEDYQYGFSDYTKNNYWLIRQGNNWIALPKPFEHAGASEILERTYEGTYGGDPTAWQRLTDGLGNIYLPPMEVTSLALPIQLWANRTATGGPVVPDGMDQLAPHLQYEASTNQMAVDLAAGVYNHTGLELSPMQLDYVMGGTFGEFFRTPSRLAHDNQPAMNLSDFPVLNRFLREPGHGGTPQRQAFYDNVMRQSSELNRSVASLHDYIERGDQQGAQAYLHSLPQWQRSFATLGVGFTDARLLHPMNRARSVVTEIGRIRRELFGQHPINSETVLLPSLTPRQSRDTLQALDDLSSSEEQAALVMSGAPGFAGRRMVDVEGRWDRLETISPGVYSTLRARLLTGDNKAIDFPTIRALWPRAQALLEQNGFQAQLGGLVARARADFGRASLYTNETVGAGGGRRTRQQRERESESLEHGLQP